MNRQELVAKIASETGSSKAAAATAVTAMIAGITKSLTKGNWIAFSRPGRQPRQRRGNPPLLY